MRTSKTYTRFCGIDVAKNRHVAVICDRDGQCVARSHSFANDANGYQDFLQQLREAGGSRRVLAGVEATGHYWYSLRDFLVGHDYAVVALNPIQTAQQAKKGIRKRKTDRIDAGHIATLLKNGDYKAALVPGALAMTGRQLTRLRYRLIGQMGRLKQQLWAHLHPIWPEYENLFADPFCQTGRRLLTAAPGPSDVLALPVDDLVALIRTTSRGKYGAAQAEDVRQAAVHTVGTTRTLEGARIAIRCLLSQLEALQPIRKQLETQITALAERLPACLLTLPGADPLRIVSLFGETDPIETFQTADQLVAFAGLDVAVCQSGDYQAPQRHISKRGSPFLRQTLWRMAYRACYQEGELRDYWLRKRQHGLHHLAAVTAVALKLCRVAWRILTDRRDYQPQRPTGKP
jgi:transposase